ncbi:MAG: ubiquinol-cytochrome c reductase iron-sulfur subunit [Bacteroidia bacterium]|nr:ubiquinol-cytochrome c reductase iron-sulfur subunit [Bacteroidia bacterium]
MGHTRKAFIQKALVVSAGACIAGAPMACSLLDAPDMRVCSLAELRQAGFWITKFNRRQIMARIDGAEITIFSLICSHKRCTVKWVPDDKQFQCPCHEGVYDAEGEVLDGPPPAPLRRFRHEVRGQELWVLNETDT